MFPSSRSYSSGGGPVDKYDYQYEMDTLMGITNHVDQLNWKNRSYDAYDEDTDYMAPPPRGPTKRKVLPKVPVQSSSKYGAAKSLPATPATSAMGINYNSRRLPCPGGGGGGSGGVSNIPTSTTITGFGASSGDYGYTERPLYKTSLSADGGEDMASGYYAPEDMHQFKGMDSKTTIGPTGTTVNRNQTTSSTSSTSKPSLLADMKSLFSKTSNSILPAMSSTLNNVSSSLSASIPPVAAHMQSSKGSAATASTMGHESDLSYDFMKSNKFEETHHGSSMVQQEMNSMYYGEWTVQLERHVI